MIKDSPNSECVTVICLLLSTLIREYLPIVSLIKWRQTHELVFLQKILCAEAVKSTALHFSTLMYMFLALHVHWNFHRRSYYTSYLHTSTVPRLLGLGNIMSPFHKFLQQPNSGVTAGPAEPAVLGP